MKAKISTKQLTYMLDKVTNSTQRDGILSYVKIEFKDQRITLTTSDENVSVKTHSDCSYDADASVLVNARLLCDVIKKCCSEEVLLELSGTEMLIRYGKSKFKLNGVAADEYPDINFKVGEDTSRFLISTRELSEAYSSVAYATSDKSRPIFGCIHLESDNGRLSLCATDSARMAKKTLDVEYSGIPSNIPSKALGEMIRIASSENECVISVLPEKIIASAKDTCISCRVMNEDYPNLSKVMSSISPELTLEVDAMRLAESLDRVNVINDNKASVTTLDVIGNQVWLTTNSDMAGEAKEAIDCSISKDDGFSISFNGAFSYQALKALGGGTALIGFTTPLKPIIIRKAGDDSLIQLFTPMKAKGK